MASARQSNNLILPLLLSRQPIKKQAKAGINQTITVSKVTRDIACPRYTSIARAALFYCQWNLTNFSIMHSLVRTNRQSAKLSAVFVTNRQKHGFSIEDKKLANKCLHACNHVV